MSGVWGAQRQASCQALGSVSGVQHQLVPVHVAGWSCSQGLGLGVLSFLAAGEPLGLGVELLHFVEAWRAACVELLEGPAKIEMSMPLPHRCSGLG